MSNNVILSYKFRVLNAIYGWLKLCPSVRPALNTPQLRLVSWNVGTVNPTNISTMVIVYLEKIRVYLEH